MLNTLRFTVNSVLYEELVFRGYLLNLLLPFAATAVGLWYCRKIEQARRRRDPVQSVG